MTDREIKKRQTKRQQIAPESITEESELESNSTNMDKPLNNRPSTASLKFDTLAKVITDAKSNAKANPMRVIANVKHMGSKWLDYTTHRRLRRKAGKNPNEIFRRANLEEASHNKPGSPGSSATAGLLGDDNEEQPKMSGIGLDDIHEDFITPSIVKRKSNGRLNVSMVIDSNRTLLQHFSKMADAPHEEAKINLDFVESLLNNGADINSTDKYGQTILHEAARAWHTDVARWLLEKGVEINHADSYGRTALHVASAVDCPEMVNLLIEWGADKEALTKDELQTPVFYAAKSDATNSLKALIKKECKYKLIRDYKGRTPIHVAAELDRSETARLLLELNAPIGVSDYTGQKAITWMITKMAPVAHEALNQFRSIDRHNRKQYFYLNLLVQDRKTDKKGRNQTPLQVAVTYKQHDLLMHPTLRRLQHVMWMRFARFWAFWNLGINFLYIILWTLIGLLVDYDVRYKYTFPDDWYRVILWIVAVAATVWQITEEVMEFIRSKRSHANWEKWRQECIQQDIKFCHPRFPEEKSYLDGELDALEDLSPKYFSDFWNIFDWTCYILLLVDIITHIADIAAHSEGLARGHIRVMGITIILLWLRLMKNARCFALLGPFIVMLGHMMKDCARFLFLYMEFYLPFMAVFWMVYGGEKSSQSDSSQKVVVDGYQYPAQLIFSLLRLTLVDDYDYTSMKEVDEVFTDIILIAWFLLSSVLCLNLFIALLSDTFQRVYDNAQAVSVMQKAITVLNIWEGIAQKRKNRFFDYIESNCSPLTEYYDDDLTQTGEEDLKKVTIQIKEDLDDLTEAFKLYFGDTSRSSNILTNSSSGAGPGGRKPSTGGRGPGGGAAALVTSEKFESEVAELQGSMRELQIKQEEFMHTYREDMNGLQTMLKQLLPSTTDGQAMSLDSQRTDSVETPVSRMKRKKKKAKPNPMEMVLSVEMLEPTAGPAALHPRSLSPHSQC